MVGILAGVGKVMLACCLVVSILGMTVLWTVQRRIIFPIATTQASSPSMGWRSVSVGAGIHAWVSAWVPGRRTAVMFHGNAVTLGQMSTIGDGWTRDGWNVVLSEFPGYDGNAGSPSEEANGKAGLMAWDWAIRHGSRSTSTVVVSNSIGTGAAAIVAQQRPVQGFLIVSGMDDMAVVVRNQVPFVFPFMVLDRMRVAGRIADVRGWMSVWHGTTDMVVPFSQGEVLARAAGVSLQARPGGHELFWMPATQAELRAAANSIASNSI